MDQIFLPEPTEVTIGIVGGGAAGLYATLYLQYITKIYQPFIRFKVHIFELEDRVGGRIFTWRFDRHAVNQYFEAGAMRIPKTKMHLPVLSLIKSLGIETIPYVLSDKGNFVYVNGRTGQSILPESVTANALGFDLPEPYKNQTAPYLLQKALEPLLKGLHEDFDKWWDNLLHWDRVSFRQYLFDVAAYPSSVIDFIETLCSQTNQYALSVPELVMQNLDFGTKTWVTIPNGMDRLPNAMAKRIGWENITLKARVTQIKVIEGDGKLKIHLRAIGNSGGVVEGLYDKVILAIPPVAVNMILDRPRWSALKEQAIRAMHYEPLFKMGLRFKTRFWERGESASFGGQSTTDLRIRWIVYPSYGLGDRNTGVLLIYSWMSDATAWASVPFEERLHIALFDLQRAYPLVKVKHEFLEASDILWSNRNPTGDCAFLPGQFSDFFDIAKRREGNIFFAGEHLSRHHTWITGALDSARRVVGKIFKDAIREIFEDAARDKPAHLVGLPLGHHVGWMPADEHDGSMRTYDPREVRYKHLFEKAKQPDFVEKMKKSIIEGQAPLEVGAADLH